ncbi:ferric reductase transmembrane component 4 [Sporothrix brasiliensis 5110]|uniref:Ferric reductase transmembrane component 4 n=1 Tax=Sporothrix brasiliensis 5110 TaxID=1398154 RepID=A0A0C2FRT0_9PEZI|nr:ferric reductase transmembrane component 4 [Sporothrix brasiliensis 5110]KIH93713.1 ferric reductase transmembrane component 4 [Sporothrix brasiliensis 5110]
MAANTPAERRQASRFAATIVVMLSLLHATAAFNAGALTGVPANNYDPYCAMACIRSLNGLLLSCSSTQGSGGMIGMVGFATSSACWASDTPYLTSLAYCMTVQCAVDEFSRGEDIPASKLEWFWETEATGQIAAGAPTVTPKWTYAQALVEAQAVVSNASASGGLPALAANATWLNTTSLVSPAVYRAQWNVLVAVQEETSKENRYGIALLSVGVLLPIVCTALASSSLVPSSVHRLVHRLKPHLVWPSTMGTYSVRPLPYGLGNAPTRGQALYIGLFVALNVVLTSVNYRARQPSAWFLNTSREIAAYILYRTGELGYILLPLVFLFGSRNNVLLLVPGAAGWSHATYLVLHRWVARVFALQAILHSVVGLVLYKLNGVYDAESVKPYWIWGIVATVMVVLLTFGLSGSYARACAYELFLAAHVVFSALLIVGCWYHAYDLYKFLGGVVDFLYAAVAVWFFDHALRVLRVVGLLGARRARVTELGGASDIVRVDVPGVRWTSFDALGKHVYVYLPTLTPWRPWENHPFSIVPTALVGRSGLGQSVRGSDDMEKMGSLVQAVAVDGASLPSRSGPASVSAATASSGPGPGPDTAGVTLYIRRANGATHRLAAHPSLFVLLEGPYANTGTATATNALLRCDRLLLIGGGIGITALLPYLACHANAKLAWSLREAARPLLDDLSALLDARGDVDDIRVGRRLDAEQLLADEAGAGWGRIGVVVSGPGGLCDSVRARVVDLAKATPGTTFELEVEAYSW